MLAIMHYVCVNRRIGPSQTLQQEQQAAAAPSASSSGTGNMCMWLSES